MIQFDALLAYVLALGITAAIPGPGITALVARSVSSGALAGFAMLAGLMIGDLIYLSFAAFGLSVVAQQFGALFSVIRWASIAFLLLLAWRFWHAEHQALDQASTRSNLFSAAFSGTLITLGNPKAIAFYLAILPLVIDLKSITVQSWAAQLIPLTLAVLSLVGGTYVLGALAIRRLLSSELAQRRLHRSAALAMAGAAGSMILKQH